MLSKRRVTLNFQGSRTLWSAQARILRRLKPAATSDYQKLGGSLNTYVLIWSRTPPIRMRTMSMMAKKARLSGDEAINETDLLKEAVNA